MAAMCSESGCVVLPGDVIQNLKESETSGKIILGPGLRREVDSVMSYRPGILTHKEPNVYWIDSHHKRVWLMLCDVCQVLLLGTYTKAYGRPYHNLLFTSLIYSTRITLLGHSQ